MPLVAPASAEGDKNLQELIRFYEETLGFCPNSVKTMHHRPEIAVAFIALNKAVMTNHGTVTSALKRLIGYVVSHVAGCRYCQAHTIRAAERYGAAPRQLDEVWEFENSSAFSEAERAALAFAFAAAQVPNGVNASVEERLKAHFNDGEIVEMLGVVALFGFLNRWNDSMATALEDPAGESAQKWLSKSGWTQGKHIG
jgi:uncharacterized peroxidase-related enzyme